MFNETDERNIFMSVFFSPRIRHIRQKINFQLISPLYNSIKLASKRGDVLLPGIMHSEPIIKSKCEWGWKIIIWIVTRRYADKVIPSKQQKMLHHIYNILPKRNVYEGVLRPAAVERLVYIGLLFVRIALDNHAKMFLILLHKTMALNKQFPQLYSKIMRTLNILSLL